MFTYRGRRQAGKEAPLYKGRLAGKDLEIGRETDLPIHWVGGRQAGKETPTYRGRRQAGK